MIHLISISTTINGLAIIFGNLGYWDWGFVLPVWVLKVMRVHIEYTPLPMTDTYTV